MKKSHALFHVNGGRVHVGTALTLAGFAILLSGSLVYAAAPANRAVSNPALADEIRRLRTQVNKLTESIDDLRQMCIIQPKPVEPAEEANAIPENCISKCKDVSNGSISSYQECVEKICTEQPSTGETPNGRPNANINANQPNPNAVPNQPNFDVSACLNACEEDTRACSINAGGREEAQSACATRYNTCANDCLLRQHAPRQP